MNILIIYMDNLPNNKFKKALDLEAIHDDGLIEALETIIKRLNLKGEYEICSVYKNAENKKYVLIYATYLEKNLPIENLESVSKNDTSLVDNAIKDGKFGIDYLFVIPYYDYIDSKKCSHMAEAIITENGVF